MVITFTLLLAILFKSENKRQLWKIRINTEKIQEPTQKNEAKGLKATTFANAILEKKYFIVHKSFLHIWMNKYHIRRL